MFFFSIVLLFFLVVYCVSVLQYRITGSAVSIEKAIQQINESKGEISRTADNVKLERKKVEGFETKLQELATGVTNLSEAVKAVAKKAGITNTSPYIEQLESCQDQVIEQLSPRLQKEVKEVRMKFGSKD